MALSWNGLVPVDRARAHIKALSEQGIGKRQVVKASGVGASIIQDISRGKKKKIRANTEKAILAVDESAAADGILVPATKTWYRLNRLIEAGWSKSELARRLGYTKKNPTLQMDQKFVRVSTEKKVKELYNDLKPEEICTECGYSHRKNHRLQRLRRLLPNTAQTIMDAWSCYYGGGKHSAGERMLYRDLKELGAKKDKGEWYLP